MARACVGASVGCMYVGVCVVVILMMVCGVGDSLGEIVGDWGIWDLFWSGRAVFSKIGGDFRAGVLGKRMR